MSLRDHLVVGLNYHSYIAVKTIKIVSELLHCFGECLNIDLLISTSLIAASCATPSVPRLGAELDANTAAPVLQDGAFVALVQELAAGSSARSSPRVTKNSTMRAAFSPAVVPVVTKRISGASGGS